MKKTWKRWLGTVAAALVTSTALAQGSNDTGVATTRGQSPSYSEEGSVRLGRASASARGTRIRQSQYVPPMDAGDVAEDMMSGSYMPSQQGGTIFSDDGAVGFASTERVNDILWRAGNQSMNAYGYNGGYTNLNAFVPIFSDGSQNVIFAIPRINFTDYGKLGANLGVGYRTYVPENDRVYGVSGWWDYDDGHQSNYQQWGMNFESIGRWLSLRGGFALPSGSDSYIYNTTLGDAQFVGNEIKATQTQFFERSYANYNAEVATPLPGLARYGFDVGMGMYVLQSPGLSNIVGGSLRTQAQLTESAWMNATYTYDHHYQSMFSLNVELTLPDGPPKQWFRRNTVQHSLTDNVIRNYRIAVTEQSKSELITLTNPGGGGSPINVAFIDANASTNGDGTRANPFQTLSAYTSLTDAQRDLYDIIYIRGMTDGSGANLTTGLTLLDTQKVLGDGVLPNGNRPTLTTAQGGISLPGTNGPLPLLSNLDNLTSPVLTLANANEISGIRIDGSSDVAGSVGSGIVGTNIESFNIHDTFIQNTITGIEGTNINWFNIHDTVISNATTGIKATNINSFDIHDTVISNVITGIDITTDTTPAVPPGVTDNYGIIKNVSITSGSSGTKGINLVHTAGTLDLLVTGNTISGFQGEDANKNGELDTGEDSNHNGVLDPGEDKDFDGVLDKTEDKNGNNNLDFGQAIEIVANGGTINANNPTSLTRPTGITSNQFTQDGSGLHLLAKTGSTINATVASNTASNLTDANADAAAFLIVADGGTMNLTNSINNIASGGLGNGLVLANRNGGTFGVTALTGNSYTGNGGDGLKIIADAADITINSLSNLTFTGNTGDGLELEAKSGGTLKVGSAIVNSKFTNNGHNGLNINADGGKVDVQIGGDVLVGGVVQQLGNTFTGNGTAGLAYSASQGGQITTSVLYNNISSNTGDGMHFELLGTNVNNATLNDTVIRGNTFKDNSSSGIVVDAAWSKVGVMEFTSNAIQNNRGGDGLRVNFKDTTAGDLFVNDSTIDANRDNGVSLGLDNSTLASLNLIGNDGNQRVTALAGFSLSVVGNTFPSANSGNSGYAWNLTNSNQSTLNISHVDFDLNNSFVFDTAGASASPFAANPANVPDLVGNAKVPDNQGNLQLDFVRQQTAASDVFSNGRSYQWNVDVDRTSYSIADVNDDPVNTIVQNVPRSINGSTVTVQFVDPSNAGVTGAVDATLTGVLDVRTGEPLVSEVSILKDLSYNKGISSNGVGGVVVNASNGSHIGAVNVRGNMIDANRSGAGVQFNLDNSSLMSASSTGVVNNTISNNYGANVGLNLVGASVSTMYIRNNDISSAVASTTDTTVTGDGIKIDVNDTSILSGGGVFQNRLIGNGGSGLALSVTGNNDAGNTPGFDAARVESFRIGGVASSDGNLFQGNGDNGASLVRQERGQFNDMLIQNNIFRSNTNDGLNVNVGGANQANLLNGRPDTMNIISNYAVNNSGDGIEFRLESDADLLANLDQNEITGNSQDGIYVSENINDARDSRSLTGKWTRNNISNNAFSGVQIQSRVGNTANDPEANMGLIIGSTAGNPIGTPPPPSQASMGNVIGGNKLDGVQFTGVGVLTIGNNLITLNGTANANGTYNNAGVNIQGQEVEDPGNIFHSVEFPVSFDDENAPGRAAQEVNVLSNLITKNVGDGVRWLNEGGHDSFDLRSSSGPPQDGITSSLNIQKNEITLNAGRGISALVRPEDTDSTDLDSRGPETGDGTDPKSSSSNFTTLNISRRVVGDLRIIGNHVKGNGQEGIYIVTTNASDQSIVSQSRDLLSENGAVGTQVRLRADIWNNQVIANGSSVIDFPATGLVVRVGTSGGGYQSDFDGGFATNGPNAADPNTGLISAANNINAGISMSVMGNYFDGNAGDDVLFHSFRSTIDPATASGTWSETEFDLKGYSGDPLARMDLVFSNNQFNSIEGNNLDISIVDDTQVGAYYNNADGVFKSRLVADNISTGPFGDAARLRNAQRLAARLNLSPNNVPPLNQQAADFLYAGVGESTFRVTGGPNFYTDQNLGQVNINQIFILDNPVYNDVFDANGVYPISPNATGGGGELPWGWGRYQ